MTSPTIERAARGLAAAFGMGDSWFTTDCQRWDTRKDNEAPEASAGLSIAWRTETLEKADKAAGIHEHHHWKRAKGIAVLPRARPNPDALAALSFAGLDGPLEDWLLCYALHDANRWPGVRLYALAVLPDPWAIDEAATRILWPALVANHGVRAKELGVRKETYGQMIRPASGLLNGWLHRASSRYLYALNGNQYSCPEGVIHRTDTRPSARHPRALPA